MNKYKKPLSIDEQVEYLKKNKRVTYNDITKDDAKEYLFEHNYINVISPFKYNFVKKDKNGAPIKNKGKHIYKRKVDFSEYIKEYEKERQIYPMLFEKISAFESTFNAVVSYKSLTEFDIRNSKQFHIFIESMLSNAANSKIYNTKEKMHMVEEIGRFESKLNKYNSPYIFFDRLSLSEIVTVYRLMNGTSKKETFDALNKIGCTLGYPVMSQFDEILTRLIQIRNCVYHGNSLTILIRYYKVKTKTLRQSSDKKKFTTLIKHILKS